MIDRLSATLITTGLETGFIGQRVLFYPSLRTTMETARQEALNGAPEGTVVITDEQTAARGRLKRTWLTPQGNIALSVVLYPARPNLHSVVMVASLAVARAIETVTGLKPVLKWPNDVMLNNKKVCGILVEVSVLPGTVNFAVVGIGINVNLDPSDFPEILPIATSLSHELGQEVSRLEIVRCLLREMERLYLISMESNAVYEQWRDRLVTLGKEVRVTSGTSTREGIAESVDPDGALLLRLPDGSLDRVLAGDVTLRE
ncbi:MAG TPA: biotin--[acetyl-CoA-carboxylase] ligase [Dehalococcoidia bacterium]|nr:biotin--[acetyl-CoA-carboxylase] ligase [Dehalococcoidia bacterium]